MLIGYAITTAISLSLALLVTLVVYDRKEIRKALAKGISGVDVVALAVLLAFFVLFSLLFVSPTEQLYFDENIYQGIAINVLSHGNALWCQYGTGHLGQCFSNLVYHDPAGWPVLLAIAFGIFGIGMGTAYATELAMGALSIVGVFLLCGVLFNRKHLPATAAMVMALSPSLFIWSRTQAVIDLPFMTLTVFTFFFFVLFMRRMNKVTFSIFASCLVLAVYMRIEGVLLLPVFALLYLLFGGEGAVIKRMRKRLGMIRSKIDSSAMAIAIFVIFMLLMSVQLYYISLQSKNADYGQQSQQLFSSNNLISNGKANLVFLTGGYDTLSYFPSIFSWSVAAAAVLGVVLLAIEGKNREKFGTIAMIGIWFIAYFVFYASFYAGSAIYGVDARFMLQLLPPLAVLAAAGIHRIHAISKARLGPLIAAVAYIAAVAVIVFAPFITLGHLITLPVSQMPQQHGISNAVNFIYQNYQKVPTNCLVFSFTPDMWYELNRSSAQIWELGANNSTISGFSCHVLDYGYWCQVPPYVNSTCKSDLSRYKLTVLATNSSGLGSNDSLYLIQNYS
ncbi:MAG: glycosyltransferase family 39 protein [Candidatus Micrarchaeota archaeon]|nr:glycosyltransferase family 39 protein [Candidatus Micrarchaeota archaeon]